MSQAVRLDGMKTGIAEQDLQHALGGRVFPKNRLDLFLDGSKHAIGVLILTVLETAGNPVAQALLPAGSRLISTRFYAHPPYAGMSAGAAD
jgi:hypothetical protein